MDKISAAITQGALPRWAEAAIVAEAPTGRPTVGQPAVKRPVDLVEITEPRGAVLTAIALRRAFNRTVGQQDPLAVGGDQAGRLGA